MATEYLARPEGLPPVNGYSHVVVFDGPMVAVSGQVPVSGTGVYAGDEAVEQVRQVFDNLAAALAAGGSGLDRVVKLTVYLTDLADLGSFREVRDRYLDPARLPACSLVQVGALVDPRFRVEIDALATR
ncbi:RidA family protein [Amycolatopsis sp. PS_44_ISF1]|uniref:RidA family protein n=1 Tax=Amycolatopsis sp. PS_44_ISF1 TaxID=2974917 RepID=UPI0028DE89A7|nr:RidA family protein [Amycolatopsis sp. PS_44_ISF1]MDT8912472.1 RidA family protein [Amycolatopsis sp. PS_44_ISF1]